MEPLVHAIRAGDAILADAKQMRLRIAEHADEIVLKASELYISPSSLPPLSLEHVVLELCDSIATELFSKPSKPTNMISYGNTPFKEPRKVTPADRQLWSRAAPRKETLAEGVVAEASAVM